MSASLSRAQVVRALAALAFGALGLSCTRSSIAEPKQWTATGTIKSFGPGRAFLNIAHEDIPGYMSAMTMSFEPQKVSDVEGFSVGDRISFTFYETEDARRVITKIARAR